MSNQDKKQQKQQAHIEHSGIYLVEEDVYVAHQMRQGEVGTRTIIIPKGELLEFRYFSPAHFRDIWRNYFPIDDRQLHKLKLVAKIWEKVSFQNNASLEDILRLKLYDEVDNPNKSIFRTQVYFTERAIKLKKHFDDLEVYTRL